MIRASFFLTILCCAIMATIACSSHKNRKYDEDIVAPDELNEAIPADEDEMAEEPDEETLEEEETPENETETGDDIGLDEDAPANDDWDNLETDIVPDEDTDSPPLTNPISVPYFCQFKNTLYPESTSGNTSLAMLLYHYGWVGTPDDLTNTWGKDKAQTTDGLAEIFNSYSETTGMILVTHLNGTFAEIKALIDQGKPVIAHTWFTPEDHVIIINGYGENGYFTNDPAGVWDLTYKGDFSLTCDQAVVGKSEFYPTAPFESAVGPDGEIRYHEPAHR